MKKILLFALIALIFGFAGCSKDEEIIVPENCTFSIDFAFPTSGEMTKADVTASKLYNDFYEQYIKTKIYTPKRYDLTFSKGDKIVASFEGEWNADLITLPEGEYSVSGKSETLFSDLKYPKLTFNQTIIIDRNTKSVSLTANYNSYLIFFDKISCSESSLRKTGAYNYDVKESFGETEDIFYAFLPYGTYDYINYKTHDSNGGAIFLDNFVFEMGKYYYFDVVSGSFSIPPMEAGEIK